LSPKKKKLWKIPLIVICFVVLLVAWLGFSDQGLIHLYRTDKERQAYNKRIHQLTEENQTLLDEIERLRTDTEYVESVIRKQLNMIKENEVIFRLNKEKPCSDGIRNDNTQGSTR